MPHDFEYVSKSEYGPVLNQLRQIIREVQEYLKKDFFTFQPDVIGSASLNMVTRDKKGNKGYDFDVNLRLNISLDDYTPSKLRSIFKNALDKISPRLGYDYCEDSTRVLTMKFKDCDNSKIHHSCDIGLIIEDDEGQEWCVYCNKHNGKQTYEFKQIPDPYELEEKIEWIKEEGLWSEVMLM